MTDEWKWADRERAARRRDASWEAAPAAGEELTVGPVDRLLYLQRTVGNHAVSTALKARRGPASAVIQRVPTFDKSWGYGVWSLGGLLWPSWLMGDPDKLRKKISDDWHDLSSIIGELKQRQMTRPRREQLAVLEGVKADYNREIPYADGQQALKKLERAVAAGRVYRKTWESSRADDAVAFSEDEESASGEAAAPSRSSDAESESEGELPGPTTIVWGEVSEQQDEKDEGGAFSEQKRRQRRSREEREHKRGTTLENTRWDAARRLKILAKGKQRETVAVMYNGSGVFLCWGYSGWPRDDHRGLVSSRLFPTLQKTKGQKEGYGGLACAECHCVVQVDHVAQLGQGFSLAYDTSTGRYKEACGSCKKLLELYEVTDLFDRDLNPR